MVKLLGYSVNELVENNNDHLNQIVEIESIKNDVQMNADSQPAFDANKNKRAKLNVSQMGSKRNPFYSKGNPDRISQKEDCYNRIAYKIRAIGDALSGSKGMDFKKPTLTDHNISNLLKYNEELCRSITKLGAEQAAIALTLTTIAKGEAKLKRISAMRKDHNSNVAMEDLGQVNDVGLASDIEGTASHSGTV